MSLKSFGLLPGRSGLWSPFASSRGRLRTSSLGGVSAPRKGKERKEGKLGTYIKGHDRPRRRAWMEVFLFVAPGFQPAEHPCSEGPWT